MKTILYKLPIILLLLVGCVREEIPDLPYNLLEDENVDLIELISVDFEFYSNMLSNVRVHFKLHEDITDRQKIAIEAIAVYDESHSYDVLIESLEQNFFYNAKRIRGSTVCYTLALKKEEGIFSRGTIFCIEIE